MSCIFARLSTSREFVEHQVMLTGSTTEYDTLVQLWVFLEMTVSVIAACLPTLAPIYTLSFYARLMERIYSFSSLLHHDSNQEQFEMKQRHTNSYHHKRHVDIADVEMAHILTDYREQATQRSAFFVDINSPVPPSF